MFRADEPGRDGAVGGGRVVIGKLLSQSNSSESSGVAPENRNRTRWRGFSWLVSDDAGGKHVHMRCRRASVLVDKVAQGRVKVVDVEQDDGLEVDADLRPGGHFGYLLRAGTRRHSSNSQPSVRRPDWELGTETHLESTVPSGQADESVAQICHYPRVKRPASVRFARYSMGVRRAH